MQNLHRRFVLYVVKVKFTVEISQNFMAFSEYMNFIYQQQIYEVNLQIGHWQNGFLNNKSSTVHSSSQENNDL